MNARENSYNKKHKNGRSDIPVLPKYTVKSQQQSLFYKDYMLKVLKLFFMDCVMEKCF